jgi:hypothetical protein
MIHSGGFATKREANQNLIPFTKKYFIFLTKTDHYINKTPQLQNNITNQPLITESTKNEINTPKKANF